MTGSVVGEYKITGPRDTQSAGDRSTVRTDVENTHIADSIRVAKTENEAIVRSSM